jgi:copper chaperone
MSRYTEQSMLKRTTLAVSGMTCGGCARTIERVRSRVADVNSATVDFDLGVAIVNGSAAPSELIAAVAKAGYGASIAEAGAAIRNDSAVVDLKLYAIFCGLLRLFNFSSDQHPCRRGCLPFASAPTA